MSLRSQQGFTLTEVLIGAAVTSIVLLGISTMTVNSMKGQRGVQQLAEADAVFASMQLVLMTGNLCKCNFQGKTFNPANPAAVEVPLDDISTYDSACGAKLSTIAQKTAVAPGQGVWIKTLQLQEFSNVGADLYFAKLFVEMQKTGETFGGRSMSRATWVRLTTATAGGTATINGCGVTAAGSGSGVPQGYQKYTANGTFTVPDDVSRVWVILVGGGGGGGGGGGADGGAGCTYYGGGGGGGGGGGVAEEFLSVTPSASYAITVGAGGNGGFGGNGAVLPANGGSGSNGGITSFGGLLSATGGEGGQGGKRGWSTVPASGVGGGGGAGGAGAGLGSNGSAGLAGGQGTLDGPSVGGSGGGSGSGTIVNFSAGVGGAGAAGRCGWGPANAGSSGQTGSVLIIY